MKKTLPLLFSLIVGFSTPVYANSFEKLLAAAKEGSASSQYDLGIAYANGKGAQRNDLEAALWFKKAAEQGHIYAQYNLGVAYNLGRGVPQDDKKAVYWYHKAAEQGNDRAQYNLGVAYHNGRGVVEDQTEAYIWMLVASANGASNAQKAKKLLGLQLSNQEIHQAQKEAKKRFTSLASE